MPLRIRYFVLDADQQFRAVPQRLFERVWRGKEAVSELGLRIIGEMMVATVVLTEDLAIRQIGFMRVSTTGGLVSQDDKRKIAIVAAHSMQSTRRKRQLPPLVVEQVQGLPSDWKTQLAAAIDVPVGNMPETYHIPGPLGLALTLGVTVRHLLDRYYEAEA